MKHKKTNKHRKKHLKKCIDKAVDEGLEMLQKEIKVGDVITLHERKRDLFMNKIGLLQVEILSIENDWDGFDVAEVRFLATGNKTKILI